MNFNASFMVNGEGGRDNGQVRPAPAMSNTERQREFRARNPGYYNKYYQRKKARHAASKARIKRKFAALPSLAQEQQMKAEQERLLAEVKARTQLCLPAPEPVVTLDMLLAQYAPPAEKVAVRVADAA